MYWFSCNRDLCHTKVTSLLYESSSDSPKFKLQSQNRGAFGGHLCEKKSGGLNIRGRDLALRSFNCKLNVDLKKTYGFVSISILNVFNYAISVDKRPKNDFSCT